MNDFVKRKKGMESKDQTLISSIDLNKMENVKMSMYLFNVENAYISENSIYLLNSDYKYNKYAFLDYMKVLAKKGVIGYVKELIDGDLISKYGEYTTIYKFEILEDGSLEYKNKTEEKVYKDSQGRVTSTTAIITGMKMALFDISDVNNPKQISQTIIGDRRTTSAILTNHKALLFSKEKGILAIPVNSYPSDFEINSDTTDINSMVKAYSNYGKKYTKEGYFVYNINLEDGIKLKEIINHDKTSVSNYYYSRSRLIRGIWIENNLFTISEDMIKVNNLEDLSQIAELNIKKAIN